MNQPGRMGHAIPPSEMIKMYHQTWFVAVEKNAIASHTRKEHFVEFKLCEELQ